MESNRRTPKHLRFRPRRCRCCAYHGVSSKGETVRDLRSHAAFETAFDVARSLHVLFPRISCPVNTGELRGAVMVSLHKSLFVSLLIGALAVLGCAEDSGGDGGFGGGGAGGSAATGGTAGTGGEAGSGGEAGGGGVEIATGLYSAQRPGTLVCLFVNEDGTKLVADDNCPWGPQGEGVAFRLTSVPGDATPCAIYYPVEGDDPQEIPIVDGRFEIEATRTAGDQQYTIMVSGEFDENGGVSGVATDSSACPDERAWSAGLGCCTACEREGWCE
jgi:hypothetical protein